MAGRFTFFIMFWFGIPAVAAYFALLLFSRGWLRDFTKMLGVFVASLFSSLMFWVLRWQRVGPDNRFFDDPALAPSRAAISFAVIVACVVIATQVALLFRIKGPWRLRSLYVSLPIVTFIATYIFAAERVFGVLTNHR
jgi:hypothetical protein